MQYWWLILFNLLLLILVVSGLVELSFSLLLPVATVPWMYNLITTPSQWRFKLDVWIIAVYSNRVIFLLFDCLLFCPSVCQSHSLSLSLSLSFSLSQPLSVSFCLSLSVSLRTELYVCDAFLQLCLHTWTSRVRLSSLTSPFIALHSWWWWAPENDKGHYWALFESIRRLWNIS